MNHGYDERTQGMQSAFDTGRVKGAGASVVSSGDTTDEAIVAIDAALAKTQWNISVFGAWAVDGDGVTTNGGGLVGAVAVATEAAAAYAKVEDDGSFANLAVAGAEAGYSANYQLFPDTPVAETDYAYFGHSVPFCEIGIDVGTAATFDSTGVLAWEYWDGAAWSSIALLYDNSNGSTHNGTLSFARDGAIVFDPPDDWAASTIDSQEAYWIRCGIASGKAANLTQVPITNSVEHYLVSPDEGFAAPYNGTITAVRLCDSASTLHTTADVKVVMMNMTTGASETLTWAQDKRNEVITSLSLAVAAGEEIGFFVVQEDGSAEPADVTVEATVKLTAP